MALSLSKNKTPFPEDDNEKLILVYQCLTKNNQTHRPIQYIAEYFDWTLSELEKLKLKYLLDNSEHLENMSLGNLGHKAYKLKVASFLKIIEHGSFSDWQNHLDNNDDFKIKHKILGHLMGNTAKYFEAKELAAALSLPFDSLHYLSDEMRNEGSVNYKDSSTKDGVDFALKISATGKGMFFKKDYLNPKKNDIPFIQMTDNSTTINGSGNQVASNKSSFAPKTIETTYSNAANASKEKKIDWPLILKIIAGVIVIITAILKIFNLV